MEMTGTAAEAYGKILSALQASFNVDNLVGLITAVLSVTVVFGIIWFIKGYVSRRIAGAFKNGNI